ncbi:hypothetical protein ATER59S_00982 [Aquamicrobium terrae]
MRPESGSDASETANAQEQMIGFVPVVDIAAGGIVHACEAVMSGVSDRKLPRPQHNVAYLKAAIGFARFVELDSLLAVKLDLTELNEPDRLLEEAHEIARELQWPIDRLVFEISGVSAFDPARLELAIAHARSQGASIALEGFSLDGTSFDRLINWRPDYIKLHPDLVRSIEKDRLCQELTLGLSRACRTFGGRIIVSEVASARQCEALTRLGISLIQGPIFTNFNPADGTAVVPPDQVTVHNQKRSIH